MIAVPLWNAVALSLNAEPDTLPGLDYRTANGGPFGNCPKEFRDRLQLASNHLEYGRLECFSRANDARYSDVTLEVFGDWARALEWLLPDEFPAAQAAEELSDERRANPTPDELLSKAGELVGVHEARRWSATTHLIEDAATSRCGVTAEEIMLAAGYKNPSNYWIIAFSEPAPAPEFARALAVNVLSQSLPQGATTDVQGWTKLIVQAFKSALLTGEDWFITRPTSDLDDNEDNPYDYEGMENAILKPCAASKWLLSLPMKRHFVPHSLAQFLTSTLRPTAAPNEDNCSPAMTADLTSNPIDAAVTMVLESGKVPPKNIRWKAFQDDVIAVTGDIKGTSLKNIQRRVQEIQDRKDK